MKIIEEAGKVKKLPILYWLIFPLGIFYMEIALNLYCFRTLIPMGVVYMLVFSAVIGMFATFIFSLFKGKARKILAFVFMWLFSLTMMTQAVYYNMFKTFTSLHSVTKAGGVFSEFWEQALVGIFNSLPGIIILAVPLVLLAVFWKRLDFDAPFPIKGIAVLAVLIVVLQLGVTLHIVHNDGGVISYSYVYKTAERPELTIPRFGVLTSLRLEVRNIIRDKGELDGDIVIGDDDVGTDDAKEVQENIDGDILSGGESGYKEPQVSYEPNMLDIDFDSLIAQEDDPEIIKMHEYFKSVEPTMKNEYTGMFEGKNLIWIVAESFSSLALDETHTPTLSKLSNEGFVFNNFYNPLWGVSTSDGEYVTLTGLVPKSGTWSFSESSDNLMYFSFGNMLSREGYGTYAYHDHTYTYYDRDKSHPNMGYDYKGVGNGLQITDQWPESDVEMIEATTPEYIGKEPFHVYYLTVSGHMNYNFDANSMAEKHEKEVEDLPYSEAARAYIACNMEFDQAMERLIDELDKAGALDDTVIVISGDHYPYGLEMSAIEELHGGSIDEEFELYHSTLIIWNSQMERTEVDKYCSSLDIMPTLANLFGLDYDSRLVMGRDIFSDADPLIMFKDMSFITEYGRYNSADNTFTPKEGVVLDDEYAGHVFEDVNNKFEYSAKILDHDYYRILFGDE